MHPWATAIAAALMMGAAPAATQAPPDVPAALVSPIDQVEVPASQAGILAAMRVREGQLVTAGQLLAQVDDSEARLVEERTRLERDLARQTAANDVHVRLAQKSLEVAQAELARAAASTEKYARSVSESEMDRLRLLVQRAKLDVEQSEFEQRAAKVQLEIKESELRAAAGQVQRHRVTAPWAGVVVQLPRHVGQWVRPGDPVVRILRLDRLRVEGFIKASALPQDLAGRPARLIVDLPGAAASEFRGEVVFVHPEIDPVNAQVRIWAEVDNGQGRLRPGMRGTLQIGGASQQ